MQNVHLKKQQQTKQKKMFMVAYLMYSICNIASESILKPEPRGTDAMSTGRGAGSTELNAIVLPFYTYINPMGTTTLDSYVPY